jgi:alpha-glucosidase
MTGGIGGNSCKNNNDIGQCRCCCNKERVGYLWISMYGMIRTIFWWTWVLMPATLIAQDSLQISSPGGSLRFRLVAGNGQVHYSVTWREKDCIGLSRLGAEGWDDNLALQSVMAAEIDTSWHPVYGERNCIRDKYNTRTFTFVKASDHAQRFQIEVRAYDEGIAFRYGFPDGPGGGRNLSIGRETTNFTVPDGTLAYFTDRAQGSYSLLPLKNWPDEAERPLTLELKNGLFVVLAEAAVVDYCRTKFILDLQKPNTIACSMYDKVGFATPFATPWRVIMVAEKAASLLEHDDLFLNLNDPCRIVGTGWIKPGKIMREMTLSTQGAEQLVDFAVKRHLDYIHFDAGWYGYEYDVKSDASRVNVDPRRNARNDLNLPEVIRYARDRGIGVFLYVNHIALEKDLDSLLPLYEKWGVAGIKFGFVNVGSYRWTVWLHEAVKKCARHHLMVDVHDEYRPTGFSRTYPNLLTVEGVRGNEEMPDAHHNTILPFTRFLCGPADYTICYYHRPELKPSLAKSGNARVLKTTSMHQMALSVIYYSPLQFMYWYDMPGDSGNEPELEFFDHVPTVWDDTRVMNGEIGRFITVARRKGNEWFVGCITNNEARDLGLPLSFLTPGKKYKATVYYDDPASAIRTKVSMDQMYVDSTTVLQTHLQPSGGEAIWIRPAN